MECWSFSSRGMRACSPSKQRRGRGSEEVDVCVDVCADASSVLSHAVQTKV